MTDNGSFTRNPYLVAASMPPRSPSTMSRSSRVGLTPPARLGRAPRLLDEALRPMRITCASCGDTGEIWPHPDGDAMACPSCSPRWLASFLRHRTNVVRAGQGLDPLPKDAA